MVKTIIKELIIFLLLLVSIALLLGILFYDYIPNTKEVPAKVMPYEFPEEVQNELDSVLSSEEDTVLSTYKIDSKDLSTFESTKQYDKGKVNPFAAYSEAAPSTPNKGGTNTNSTNNNGGSDNSSGQFFEEPPIK